MRLPKRVVIHKRTHFTHEEQEGLAQGLEGVQNVELIEINAEESIRLLASRLQGDKLMIDRFPMPRGAAIVLGDDTALLWVHGHAPSVQNERFKYYLRKATHSRSSSDKAIPRWFGSRFGFTRDPWAVEDELESL